jgi:ATP-dependent exoDNAse (exonuclease V) beta subunit
MVSSTNAAQGIKRNVGEIVHRALRFDRRPTLASNLEAILLSYAHELGVADALTRDHAVTEALKLLARCEAHPLLERMRKADAVYREIPFTLEHQGQPLNGVIDVLFLSYRKWYVIDYKTAYVPLAEDIEFSPEALQRALEQHAVAYYPRMASYAEAVNKLTGQSPLVHIYYVRYSRDVEISPDSLKTALQIGGTKASPTS